MARRSFFFRLPCSSFISFGVGYDWMSTNFDGALRDSRLAFVITFEWWKNGVRSINWFVWMCWKESLIQLAIILWRNQISTSIVLFYLHWMQRPWPINTERISFQRYASSNDRSILDNKADFRCCFSSVCFIKQQSPWKLFDETALFAFFKVWFHHLDLEQVSNQ